MSISLTSGLASLQTGFLSLSDSVFPPLQRSLLWGSGPTGNNSLTLSQSFPVPTSFIQGVDAVLDFGLKCRRG